MNAPDMFIHRTPQYAPDNPKLNECFQIEEPEHEAELDQEEEEEKVVEQIVHEVVSPEQLQLEVTYIHTFIRFTLEFQITFGLITVDGDYINTMKTTFINLSFNC